MKINDLIHKLIDIQSQQGNLEIFTEESSTSALVQCENLEVLKNDTIDYGINNNLIEKFVLLTGTYNYD